MIKISKPSKMQITGKKVGCWSLQARASCPGSKNPDGSVVEVCQSCYATKGMYRFPVVKAARQTNKEDYRNDDWVERMVKEVSKYDYFRWFDSGDIETEELAAKIRLVMHKVNTEMPKKVRFWLPTRSDKIPAIQSILNGAPCKAVDGDYSFRWNPLQSHDYVALRLSADNIGLSKTERPGVNSYVIRPTDVFEAVAKNIHICPVTAPGSTQKSCDTCTACYTDIKVAYVIH